MNFGKALKTIRLIQNLKQADVAEHVHMDARSLREIEAGRIRVAAELIEVFANFYQVEVKFIYDLARDQIPMQDLVFQANRDRIISSPKGQTDISTLPCRLEMIEQRLKSLESYLKKS